MKKLKIVYKLSIFILLLVLTVSAARADVVINEFMPVIGSPLLDPSAEYFELYNNASSAVDLTGYTISYASETYALNNVTIPAKGYVTLANSDSVYFAVYGSMPSQQYSNTTPGLKLSSSGVIELNYTNGTLANTLTYAGANADKALGLDHTGTLSTLPEASPGKSNDVESPKFSGFKVTSTLYGNAPYMFNVTVTDLYDVASVTATFDQLPVTVLNDENEYYFQVTPNAGTYDYVWNATDSAGNKNVTARQFVLSKAQSAVNLTIDNQKSDLTTEVGTRHAIRSARLEGEENVSLLIDGSLNDSGTDFETSINFTGLGTFNITLRYDESTNYLHSQETYFVTVVDTTLPMITRLGPGDVTVELGTAYVDAGATATDNFDGDITSQIVTFNPVNVSNAGAYVVTYNVNDSSANGAIEVTRNVTVEDTTDPVFTTSPFDETLEFGLEPLLQPVSVTDESLLTYAVNDTRFALNHENLTNATLLDVGSYAVELNVTDARNNSVTQMATITVEDTKAPLAATSLSSTLVSPTNILWTWQNPGSDFNHTLVYLQGNLVAVTADNQYNATNLGLDTTYTLTLNTSDVYGNINSTLVSNTNSTPNINLNLTIIDYTSTVEYTERVDLPYVEVNLENTGTTNITTPFNVVLYACNPDCEQRSSTAINSLNAKNSTNLTFTYSLEPRDVISNTIANLYASADAFNVVPETIESDNNLSQSVTVTGYPFRMSLDTCTPTRPNLSNTVNCSIDVEFQTGEIDVADANMTLPNGTVLSLPVHKVAPKFYVGYEASQRGAYSILWSVQHKYSKLKSTLTQPFTVYNRAPINNATVPNATIAEDTSVTYNVSNYFKDLDGDNMTFHVIDLDNFTATVNDGQIVLEPFNEFSGNETLFFLANDTYNDSVLSNEVLLTVTNVTDVPQITLPNITFNEDSVSAEYDLTAYVVDDDSIITDLDWSIASTSSTVPITMTLNDNNATFSTLADRCGESRTIISAYDGFNTGYKQVLFNVTCTMDAPGVVSGTPAVVDTPYIDLNFTVSDADLGDNLTVLLYHTNQSGTKLRLNETINVNTFDYEKNYIFRIDNLAQGASNSWYVNVSDNAAYNATTGVLTYTVDMDESPNITSYSPSTGKVQLPATEYQLFEITAQDDNAVLNVSWYVDNEYVDNWHLNGLNATNRTMFNYTLSGYKEKGLHNLSVFVFDAIGQNDTQSWQVNVTYVNTAPVIDPAIPDQFVMEDTPLELDLTQYENDREHLDTELTWSVTGYNPNYLTISIDTATDLATITPSSNVYGDWLVNFTLTDADGLTASQNVNITVANENDNPIIDTKSPAVDTLSVAEGTSQIFSISARDVEMDTISYEWSINGTIVSTQGNTYTFAPTFGDAGDYLIIVSAVDDKGFAAADMWTVTVTDQNEPPQITSTIPNVRLDEDQEETLDLTAYESDAEDDNLDLTWSVEDNDDDLVITSLDTLSDVLTIIGAPNANGETNITLVLTDSVGARAEQEITVTVDPVNDAPVFDSIDPSGLELSIANNVEQEFEVEASDADGDSVEVLWYVDNSLVAQGQTYTFEREDTGDYEVSAHASDGESTATTEWEVTVLGHPVLDDFNGDTTDVSSLSESELSAVDNFVLEKTAGAKIEFLEQLDLRDVVEVSGHVTLTSGLIALDTSALPELSGKRARLTMYSSTFGNPVIFRSSSFTSDPSQATELCTSCVIVNTTGRVEFEVDGFSTYVVKESSPADLVAPSTLSFEDVEQGVEYTKTLQFSNAGSTTALTGLTLTASGVEISLDGVSYSNEIFVGDLTPLDSKTLSVRFTFDGSEDSGETTVGSVLISSNEESATVDVVAVIPTMLSIKELEFNGDDLDDGGSVELEPGDDVEVDIEVENLFEDLDIEDVEVEVTIFDIDDGDDIEEESDEFDIDAGDEESESFSFTLPLLLDDDEYDVRVLVTGRDEDGGDHEVQVDGIIEIDREKHDLRLNAQVFPSDISCDRTPNVRVNVYNVGEDEEEDVVIQVENSVLGIDVKERVSEIDEADDHRDSIPIDLSGAGVGTYTLNVKVYADDTDLMDSTSVDVTVSSCGIVSESDSDVTERQVRVDQQELIRQILESQTQAQDTPAQNVVSVQAEDNALLWLVVAIIIVLNLGLIVFIVGMLATKKKRKRRLSKEKK